MSLTFIQAFQHEIYKSLSEDRKIMTIAQKICLGPVHNIKPPFISINVEMVTNQSTMAQEMYNIDYTISIFSKDKNYNQLSILSDMVVQNLEKMTKNTRHYKVIGSKTNKINFITGKDLVIHKADINYNACITKGN